MAIIGKVQQDSYPATPDATEALVRLNRRNELVVPDYFTQLALDGRVFVASDADGNDTIAAIATWVATTPQLLLKVPTGTTAIPLWLDLNNDGATAGATGSVIIMLDKIDRYSSGGTEETVNAYRTDAIFSNACKVYSTPTAAAASAARTIFTAQYETDDGTTGRANTGQIHWNARVNIAPVLVGPAAFLVWIDDNAATPTFEWSLGWAEFPSTSD